MVVTGKTENSIFWYFITSQHITIILQQMYMYAISYFNQNRVHWSHFHSTQLGVEFQKITQNFPAAFLDA